MHWTKLISLNSIRLRQLAGLGFIVFLVALNLNLFYGFFLPNARPNPPGAPDIPKVLWSYFTNSSKLIWLWNDLLFGRGLQGSSIWVKYLILPMFLGPLGFAVQEYLRKRFRIEGRILYTTWAYIIVITIFTWFAATVNGIAQAEDWYYQTIRLADGSELRIPGSFDVCTHANIGAVLVGWFLTLAWSSWFGVDKLTAYISVRWAFNNPYWLKSKVGVWIARNLSTICETFDELISSLLVWAISLYFEYLEFINPDRFFNLVGNSWSDMFAAGLIGWLAFCYAYQKLVSAPIRSYQG